jgi:DNA-binding FrmR family transcriptional regulator
MELLDDVLDGLDRLFDRESDVNDVFALIVATSHALANTCHSKVLSDATRGLELVVRKGASKEEARDEALQVTDQLRHYLADLSPF